MNHRVFKTVLLLVCSVNVLADGVPMTPGNWEFTSDGDSVVGIGSMRADMGGMAMEMNMNWEGTRLGDCK